MDKKIINFKVSKENEVFSFFELANQSNDTKKKLYSFVGSKEEKVTKDVVASFVDSFYKNENQLIKEETIKIEKIWEHKQDYFIEEAKNIFGNIDVFDSVIIASPSIWPLYGRFFERQLITFPFNRGEDEAVFVIAHEYLHFMFYKYLFENFQLNSSEMSSQKVWDFSEVINVVIQNQESWLKTYKVKASPHPQHIELYKRVLNDWKSEGDINKLIKNYLL